MSLKDRFDNFISYFMDDGDVVNTEQSDEAPVPVAVGETSSPRNPAPTPSGPSSVNSPRPTAPRERTVRPTPQPTTTTSGNTAQAVREPVRETKSPTENITRLHARQQELSQSQPHKKVTIDVRYPRKYEEATEIVDLLIANESILIDFQYMTEVQARRCLDYIDGARYVLAGNLRKVASTMYLLTPINVVVNIEDIRLPDDTQLSEYDFDMKRR